MANRTTHQVIAVFIIFYMFVSFSCVTRNKATDSVNKIAVDSVKYRRMQDSLTLGADCLHVMDSFFVQYDKIHDYYPHNLDSFMCTAFNCIEKGNIKFFVSGLNKSMDTIDSSLQKGLSVLWKYGKEVNWYELQFGCDGHLERIRLKYYFGPGIQAISDNYKPIVDVQKPPRSQKELRDLIHQNNLKVVTERKSKYPCIEIDSNTTLNNLGI